MPRQIGGGMPTAPDQTAPNLKGLVGQILDEARRLGATAAEVAVGNTTGLSVGVRKGELETVEFNNDRGFGITVYVGDRKGSASTSDASPGAVQNTVRQALNIAKYTEADSCNGLADADLMATTLPDLDIDHPWAVDVEDASQLALTAEAAALGVDKRIVNSEGARLVTQRGCHVYGNSHGFVEAAWGTRHSLSCSVIAADKDGMQSDYAFTIGRADGDLDDAAAVGREAGRRTIARLGHRPVQTGRYPVLFDAPTASGLFGHLLSAISGTSLYRKESYLLDSLGRQATAPGITLAEDPHRRKGLASAAHDGDGVATRAKSFVDDGVVTSYILGSYSARRLGLATTGNAGGVFNLDVVTDAQPAAALMQTMGNGLLVTSLMGQGVNLVTGDYSRAAAGMWISNGEPAYPVDRITIASNLDAMFKGIVACGDDIDKRHNIRTGSVLVRDMTIAA
ncbi:MAG: metalloprotease PmbA [Gammaproteobacteria bacterium]|nr:metalloprotease PmbA [Gammaproteobacteria bacterium]